MKKVSLMDNVEHLSEQAKKDLLEIEQLLNRSHKDLVEIQDNLDAIEKSFAFTTPPQRFNGKIYH